MLFPSTLAIPSTQHLAELRLLEVGGEERSLGRAISVRTRRAPSPWHFLRALTIMGFRAELEEKKGRPSARFCDRRGQKSRIISRASADRW